jgi:hypothetical protein
MKDPATNVAKNLTLGLRTRLLGVAVGVTALLGIAPTANAETRAEPVTG